MIDFVSLQLDERGCRVCVAELGSGHRQIFEVDFGYSNLAVRSMDEGSYLSMSWDVEESDEPIGPIVIVTGSDFLDWFQEQSCGVYLEDSIIHVAVLTQNDWVEVLCTEMPVVRTISSQDA